MKTRELAVLTCWVILLVAARGAPAQTVRIVNLIPKSNSAESDPNPEPTIAVNPNNPLEIVATAQLPGLDFCSKGTRSSIFVSDDGGTTWKSLCTVERRTKFYPGDHMARFSGDGSTLFLSYIIDDKPSGHLASTTQPGSVNDLVTIIGNKSKIDQPQLQTIPDPASASYLVGSRKNAMYSEKPGQQCLPFTLFGRYFSTTSDVTNDTCAFPQRSGSESGPEVRVSVHSDGTVYAMTYLGRPNMPSLVDVLVVRGDPQHIIDAPMQQLKDGTPGHAGGCPMDDGLVGVRVVRCVPFPTDEGNDPKFGCQTRGAAASIAVDPRNGQSKHVFLAWVDSAGNTLQTIHVRQSQDSGRTWGSDIQEYTNATSPVLAVNADGRVALFYQALVKNGDKTSWQIRVDLGDTQFANRTRMLLADAPVDPSHCPVDPPYLGDYFDMVAVGNTFYGVFAAPNDTTSTTFTPAAVFQRRMSGGHPVSLVGQYVPVSIDPYFFSIKN